jgi:hypothetical protein
MQPRTAEELNLLGKHIVMRTERGNALVQSDPRQMPRRLRVLLLAIDGQQPVQLYTQTLKGFGDVSALLMELIGLGMVCVLSPAQAKQEAAKTRNSNFAALDHLLDDSSFNSQHVADVLYGSTTPGSFDEMLRVARVEQPQFKPAPAAAPAPIAPPVQQAQIESLFNMLDAVRGERKNLKQQIVKLQRVKDAARQLHAKNQRLENWIMGLGITCAVLATSLIITLLRR